ncbi:hypothetical protein [Nocardiopsis sp. NRRL B-16309]|uniref:hypothetical protein n=1 Tax=Nocardiopsis sp. NRRL B-16309 TaxID=1519494 RepID=UPI0009E903AB|nr:hypothetical protein [Nocardiopsis sp. NRRL B-16309]
MPKRKKNTNQRRQKHEQRFVVRGERRDPPDMRKLGRALLSLAQAEAERQAQAEHAAKQATTDEEKNASSSDGGDQDAQRGS